MIKGERMNFFNDFTNNFFTILLGIFAFFTSIFAALKFVNSIIAKNKLSTKNIIIISITTTIIVVLIAAILNLNNENTNTPKSNIVEENQDIKKLKNINTGIQDDYVESLFGKSITEQETELSYFGGEKREENPCIEKIYICEGVFFI